MNLLSNLDTNTLPPDHDWCNEPKNWHTEPGKLTVSPNPETDLFCAADGRVTRDTACLLKTEVSGDFTAAAHMSAELVVFGDASVIKYQKVHPAVVRFIKNPISLKHSPRLSWGNKNNPTVYCVHRQAPF